MANIYNEQGITQTPVAKIGGMSTSSEVKQSAKYFEAIQDNFERKAKEHQALAEKLYENGSNIAITQGLNELSRNPKYASNPEAFALEADKMAEKIYAQIDDPNMKTEVAMNYELKKNPYINRAYAHMYKQQNDQLEYQALIGIQDNMDSLGISIENVMDGTMRIDDLRVLSESKKDFDNYLSTKDTRGYDIFTPMQKVQLERQYNQNVINRLKGGYLQLPIQERQKIADTLREDAFSVSYKDKDGIDVNGDIKEMLPTKSYLDFKDFVLRVSARAEKIAGSKENVSKEIQELADKQTMNSLLIESEMKNIKEIKKDKPVERVLRNLELQDNILGMGEDGLSDSDRKKYKKETVGDLLEALKNEENVFDDAWIQESSMSVALQALKHDGKIAGDAWGDDMSVVMIRDFYSMAKETGLDLRATDSASRESAKKLASKAISNTIERVAGGYGKDYNSIFINGRKVSKQPIKQEERTGYVNTDYILNGNKKTYNETGIEVDL